MWRRAFSYLMLLMAVVMAVPRMAHAYVDPGTGTMIWQVAAGGMIGCLFYVKRAANWIRQYVPMRSERSMGFVFATCFALVASPITAVFFQSNPLPRFNDLFLVGIVLTAYLFTWEGSTFLLLIALLVSAWVLPPFGSMRVDNFADWYRLASFALVSVFLICLITRMKTRRAVEATDRRSFPMHSATAGVS